MNKRIDRVLQSGIDQGLYTTVSFGLSIKSKRLLRTLPISIFENMEHKKTKFPKIFDTASVTKLFLTLLVYRLITIRTHFILGESNRAKAHRISKFDLDTLVSDVVHIEGSHTDKLRVRHLLNFHAEFNTFSKPEEVLVTGDVEKMLREIRTGGLVDAPGVKFRYSNAHPILLGIVLEEVFGFTLEELIYTHLCKPLGLTHTTENPSELLGHAVHTGFCPLSKEEVKLELGEVSDPVARVSLSQGRLLGSSGLFSSVSDILTLLEVILREGKLFHHEWVDFIKPELIHRLFQSETEAREYGTGVGLWEVFRQGLEKFNPTAVEDAIFKSGYSGIMTFVSKSIGSSFVCQTDFLHKRRSEEELKKDRRKLHEIYALLAEILIQESLDASKISECTAH